MNCESNIQHAPFFAINRLRIGTDGPGISTLACFMGCPLRCAYCLNDRCHESVYEKDGISLCHGIRMMTPQQLYDRVKIDDLYFQATGGGICFGGGEPALYSSFIKEFRVYCGNRWKITIETALRCPDQAIKELAEVVDLWIVDVKDLHDDTYLAYTGKVSHIKHSLQVLKQLQQTDRVRLRVPLIPAFNDEQQVKECVDELKELGFNHIEAFRYAKRASKFSPLKEQNIKEAY